MPYIKEQVFSAPENEDQMIWRYMGFSKFLSALDKKALFFSRVDLLGDPFEGSVSKPTFKAREASYMKLQKEKDLSDQVIEHLRNSDPGMFQISRKWLFVNCWSMSDYESPALWSTYGKGEDSVAVQSTFSCLVKSLDSTDRSIFIGKVKYLDYEEEYMLLNNIFHPMLHKRKGFNYERELRATLFDIPVKKNGAIDVERRESTRGHYVLVDFGVLIESLYIHPTAPDWFLELVQSIMGKYELGDKKIVRSTLASQPVF